MTARPHGRPRVSVILATYRRQHVLPRAIKSVLDQTVPDWELIVVDDEPSADTARIVGAFRDSRIRYLAHDGNRGVSAARNTGLRHARGEYVAFLDDDDVFLERKLERQSGAFERLPQDVGMVSCFEEIHRPDGVLSIRRVCLDGDMHRALLRNDLVRMQVLTVRRVCFDRVGVFDERLEVHEDFDMTLRLSRSFRFATVAEPLVGIFATEGSISRNLPARIRALETMMAAHPEFREERSVRARWERRLARHYGELGDGERWRLHVWRALRADPASVAGWAALGAGALFGSSMHLRLARIRGRIARASRDASA